MGPPPRRYSMKGDLTLTLQQSSQGGFRPEVVETSLSGRDSKSFRFPSNPTLEGYNSGYHESFGTTDTVKHISKRKASRKQGLSDMPTARTGFYKKKRRGMREKNLEVLLGASDGARTDTAQTVLSVPGGGGAGHTGSGVKTSGQSKAHDLLRDVFMKVSRDEDMTPGAIELIGGSLTIASMAPGKVARTVTDSRKLKATKGSKNYEGNRNIAKRRLKALQKESDPQDVELAMKYMEPVMDKFPDRHFARKRLSSPERDISGPKEGIQGGDYLPGDQIGLPELFPPKRSGDKRKDATSTLAFLTESFRAPRVENPKRQRESEPFKRDVKKKRKKR